MHHPGAVRRQHAGAASRGMQRHPGRSRIQPESWHSFADVTQRGIFRPASGRPLGARSPPGRLVWRAASRGVDAQDERRSRACYAFSGSERRGSGRASVEPTRGAHSMVRAAFSRRASGARLLRPRTADASGPPSLVQRWLRSNGGDCQLPLEPRRARINALHTGVFPGMRASVGSVIFRVRSSNPGEGVEFARSSGTSLRHCAGKFAGLSGAQGFPPRRRD